MSVLIVIPARYASTRFPGKPLAALKGADGVEKSLIRRSWDAACAVRGVARVVIGTDDDRIKAAAEAFGADVVMTSSECKNGTERCSEAVKALGEVYNIVVNFQGDAPLTPHWFVEDLIKGLNGDSTADVATPVLRCDARALNGFLEDRAHGRVGGTTAVFGTDQHALYFSKEVVPFTPKRYNDGELTPVFHHVGVYAYRPSALETYITWPVGPLEALEGLEQLRFLENARRILCVEVDAKDRQFWELNNPEDIPRLEEMMQEMDMR